MRTVTLVMDHTEHRPDGKVIKHKAGATVELPDDVAEFINRAIVERRIATREAAAAVPLTPEWKAAQAAEAETTAEGDAE